MNTPSALHENLPDEPVSRRKTFVDSSDLLADADALRQRAEAQGYLFFKQLIPRDDLMAVRQELLDVVRQNGWLDPSAPLLDGVINLPAIRDIPEADLRTDIGVAKDIYDDVQKRLCTHKLPHHPKLLQVFETLFGSEVLVHPRHIVRMITAHPAISPTPAHQDHPLIQGTPKTWTCWFPVGDCPRDLGGLTVLQGSHRLGSLPIQPAKGAGGISSLLCPGDGDGWVSGDFEMGDVLMFTSTTVHKALPCRMRDRMRLSFDVRYQPAAEPVESRSLLPHCNLDWEDIYAGWPDTEEARQYEYYWEDRELVMSPYDDSLRIPGRRIC